MTTGPSRLGDGGQCLPEPLAIALEEIDVRPGVVIGDVVDLVEVGVELGRQYSRSSCDAPAEHRDVDDLDVDVARQVLVPLLGEAQVDDPGDPVVVERAPAIVRQAADVVRTDDRSRAGRRTVLRRNPTEVAHVDAAVPGQGPRTRCRSHDRPMVSTTPAVGRRPRICPRRLPCPTCRAAPRPPPRRPDAAPAAGAPLRRPRRPSGALDQARGPRAAGVLGQQAAEPRVPARSGARGRAPTPS